MILVVIFISLSVTWFLVSYFDRRRDEKNYAQHERRRDAYTNLLNSLREKNNTDTNTINPDNNEA
jgi:hypothetical protein